MKLKIYVLVDNTAGSLCKAEHGLSYLIEYDDKVLFDVGQSDLFLDNAKQMYIDLNNVKTVVLSHGHYDHGNGLRYIEGKKLIAHPGIFSNRFSGKQRKYVGLELTEDAIRSKFQVATTKEPQWLSEKMVFLGEIPRIFSFEKKTTSFYLENGNDDLLVDDSAIAIVQPQGLFIITGCSHSGICNIIEYAKQVTGVDKVFGVMGGFHLKQNNRQTKETISYLKALNPSVVMPSHCTALPALSQIYNEFKGEQVKAGSFYTFEDTVE